MRLKVGMIFSSWVTMMMAVSYWVAAEQAQPDPARHEGVEFHGASQMPRR